MIFINLRCNLCGKELDFWDKQENYEIETTVGYGSKYDGEHIRVRFCCACFDRIVTVCQINPIEEAES